VSSFPNPFTGQAMVQYHLPENSDGSVSLVVMNALGQKAESFHSLPAGGTLMWGNQLQAGIYYVQLLLNGQPVKTIKAAKQ
jgi:hypothetical protein